MRRINKVVRISYSGGLLGLLFGSARGKLENVLEDNNRSGWNLAEVIPDNPNLLILVLRLVILIVTLGLWTLSHSYLLILERPVDAVGPDTDGGISKGSRREPTLFATR